MKPGNLLEGVLMGGNDEILYRLNDRDEIVFVNDVWSQFATANDGRHLVASQVLGRSLWDFITDLTTRQLYRDRLKRLRLGRSVQFTFRCDSPACRRLMGMRVALCSEGEVEFRPRSLSQQDRQSQPLLETGQARSDERVLICRWCLRVKVGDRWLELEEAVFSLRLFESPVLPLLNHAMCETCYEEMRQTLGAHEARQ